MQNVFLLSKLCQYNFEVHHKPGKLNVSADFLSRMAGNVEYEKLQRTLPQPEWTRVNETAAKAKPTHKEVATGGATIEEGGEKEKEKEQEHSRENVVAQHQATEIPPADKNTHNAPLRKPNNVSYIAKGLLESDAQVIGHQCNCEATRPWGNNKNNFREIPRSQRIPKPRQVRTGFVGLASASL